MDHQPSPIVVIVAIHCHRHHHHHHHHHHEVLNLSVVHSWTKISVIHEVLNLSVSQGAHLQSLESKIVLQLPIANAPLSVTHSLTERLRNGKRLL